MNRPSWLPERPKLPSLPGFEKPLPEDESSLVADERAYEQLEQQERKEAFLEQSEAAPTTAIGSQASTQVAQSVPAAIVKDEVTLAVERILEDGLSDYVAAMPEEARVRFLYKGQETASRIGVMVRTLKIHAKKVVELICDWLLTIPGVNKFFLEQEAKIKTDRILELEREYRERKS